MADRNITLTSEETRAVLLSYEIASSRWAWWLAFLPGGADLAARYFTWKVDRKLERWERWGRRKEAIFTS